MSIWSDIYREALTRNIPKFGDYLGGGGKLLKGNDILLLFAILFLWLNWENHLLSQNTIILSEYKIKVI